MTLRASAPGTAVIACSTCRWSAGERDATDGRRGGAVLAAALRRVKASDPRYDDVAVDEMACLFACADHCTVHLRAPGRAGYVLGRFAATDEDARAILEYARLYAQSAEGQVPYRLWPEGVKGHFIVRTPPPGMVIE